MPRRAPTLLLLATLLLAAPTAAAAEEKAVLVAADVYVTGIEPGPDRDRDGYPAYVSIHRERFVVYENGLAERQPADSLRVTVDDDDRDDASPMAWPGEPVPSGFHLEGDADGDGIPDALVIRREYASPGAPGHPAPPFVVPIDPDTTDGPLATPTVGGAIAPSGCGGIDSLPDGRLCLGVDGWVRVDGEDVDRPSASVAVDLSRGNGSPRPRVDANVALLGLSLV